jgi:uncharacterized LabA/DUF88 family protein
MKTPHTETKQIHTKDRNNRAFIDAQNVNLGIQQLGWKLDWRRFRVYLQEKYGVSQAFLFIGFTPKNKALYTFLQQAGFVLMFKETYPDHDGKLKGNVDAELIMSVMTSLKEFDQAVVVSGDGDFGVLVKYLVDNHKLFAVVAPNRRYCSRILRQASGEYLIVMDQLRNKLEYKPVKKKRTL